MRARSVIISCILIGSIAFALYLGSLYNQLKTAFNHQEQYVPTRIYSDVSRIAPAQTRKSIESLLHSLAYTDIGGSRNAAKTTVNTTEIQFTLHPIDYPAYLIPENHPQMVAARAHAPMQVRLVFSGPAKDDLLQAIELDSTEIPDLYLEPEIVMTLTRGGTSKDATQVGRPEGRKEIRTILKFDDIPAKVWEAIISVEDQHFQDHKGLDPRGIARAIYVDLKTHSFAQGGSTITSQLVKNLMERHSKNFIRKINELFLALMLEATFKKTIILERYLNEVNLGQVGSYEIRGVAEGAKHFFGKDLNDLNLAEIALMAGLIRGTGYYSPYRYLDRALERQRLVLRKMVEAGYIADSEAQAAMKLPIHLAPPSTIMNKAPYFTDFVKAELISHLKSKMSEQEITEAGFRVYTTLDLALNSMAQEAVASGINQLEAKMKINPKGGGKLPENATDRLEGALASVDQTTGFVRALVGGRNYGQSNFNRILNMKRQVGSTFKPIVFLTAFQIGRDPKGVPYSPGHPIEDGPWTLTYDRGKQNWQPKNYEKDYLGWIPFRKALANSINTATARLGFEVGIDNVIKSAKALGIQSDLPAVPSLSLGVAELTPIELLQVYGTFANHGMQNNFTVMRSITEEDVNKDIDRFTPNSKKIFDPGPIDLLIDMLQSVFTEGTAHEAASMGFDRPAAGKTGTTSHHRDAWFAGFTPQLTTVVWVGMDQPRNDSKVKLTGADGALPIWVNFMKNALEGEPPAEFPLSPNLVNESIDTHTGLTAESSCPSLQVITEKFEKGNEPHTSSCALEWPPSTPKTDAP